MRLRVIVDGDNQKELLSSGGIAYLLEDENSTILFDCGCSEKHIRTKYGNILDVKKVTDIVLAGNKSANIKGFARLNALRYIFDLSENQSKLKNLMAHPDVFKPKDGEIYMGSIYNKTEEDINKFFNLILDKTSKYINHNFIYLGEKPDKKEKGDNKNYSDVISLIYKSNSGLIIISGKLTLSLNKVMEYAKYIASVYKIRTFIGGLNLANNSEDEIENLGKYLQTENLRNLYLFTPLDENHNKILSKYVNIKTIIPNKDYTLV